MYEDSIQVEFTFSDAELSVGGHIDERDLDKARALLGAIAKILGFTKMTPVWSRRVGGSCMYIYHNTIY